MPEIPGHLDRLAHDLRGPLSPLQTAAYLLRRDDLDDARRAELAEIVQRQTTRLGGMIDEVGDWVRADQSRLVRRREPTELGLLLDLVLANGAAAQAGLTGWPLEPGLDQAVVGGDPQRLAQMLGTLVAYAHSRAGDGGAPIRLSGRRHEAHVLLCVAESGPVLPAEALAGLFDTPQAAPYDEGLGLRLMIAQAIARAHDGWLHARAGEGGGTEYCAQLPLLDGGGS